MARILITGITGTVMSPLGARLLEEGHSVVALIRKAHGISAEERLQKLMEMRPTVRNRVSVITGDVRQPLAGVSPEDRKKWTGQIDKVIHGAASIKFRETPGKDIHRTNVCGTQEMLRLATNLGIPEFHHISTIYVAGDAQEFCESDIPDTQILRNAYENSKAQAEQLVRGFTGKTSIYRIPIVVGDSQTGAIDNFSGYYNFFAPFWQLKQSLLERWQRNRAECENAGISIDDKGNLHIPLFIPCTKVGPLNLVPVDWLSTMLLHLASKVPAQGRTFHLVHPNPRGIQETIQESLSHLGFRGIATAKMPPGQSNGLVQTIQTGILRALKPYDPYTMKDKEVFYSQKTRDVLGEAWQDPLVIDSAVLKQLLEVAKSRNFGR